PPDPRVCVAVVVPIICWGLHVPEKELFPPRERPDMLALIVLCTRENQREPLLCFGYDVAQLLVRLTEQNTAPLCAVSFSHVLHKIHEQTVRLARTPAALVQDLKHGACQKGSL